METSVLTAISRDLQYFYSFARLSHAEQLTVLKYKGILLDTEKETNLVTDLYFVDGFFVEVLTCPDTGITEILPFKKGFSIRNLTQSLN